MSIEWSKPNGRWRFRFRRVIAGRRVRADRLLPKAWSRAQAHAYDIKESARIFALATGVERQDEPIERAVELYLRDKTALKSYDSAVEHLSAIAWAYAGKPMSALPQVAAEVCAQPEMAPATKRNRLALLKAACRHAWKRHGLTQADPTQRMELPAVRNERHVYATRRQMLAIARAADRHDVRILVRVAFYTGMRLGEVLRVEVGSDGLLHLADTKNGERRSIPVHPRIRCCLDYLPLAGPRITLQRGYQRARRAVGLDSLRLHDMRHSAASEMVNAGVDLFAVGRVLGHRDPRSTQRYSHLTAGTLADAVGRIGRKRG